jgi:hypothetical protein
VADEHHGLLAEREHLERPVRRGVREDPEVGLVPQHGLDHLVRVEALQQDARVGVHRHERLHVAAHVVESDRVDRGHADAALDALPRGGELRPGLVELRQESPAGLVEPSSFRGRLERPAGAVQELNVEVRLELLDRLARRGLGDPAQCAAARDAAEAHHVAVELQCLDLHTLSLLY